MIVKKSFLIIGLVLPISGSALAGDPPAEHPATGDSLVIDCLKGTPSAIDGKLNDWQLNYLTPAILDTEEQIFSGVGSWDGPDDVSGTFYIMWDDKKIYMGVVVKDDTLSMNKDGATIWNADAIEVFFSTTNAVAGHDEHYQFGFNANEQIWNWDNMDGAGQEVPDYLEAAATETDDGYICEAAIEYGKMKSLDFSVGEAIGFHPVIDDTDGADREIQITWVGREAHDQGMGFGHIILSAEAAAVSHKDKLAATWGAIKQ